jgi:hypothetical protein
MPASVTPRGAKSGGSGGSSTVKKSVKHSRFLPTNDGKSMERVLSEDVKKRTEVAERDLGEDVGRVIELEEGHSEGDVDTGDGEKGGDIAMEGDEEEFMQALKPADIKKLFLELNSMRSEIAGLKRAQTATGDVSTVFTLKTVSKSTPNISIKEIDMTDVQDWDRFLQDFDSSLDMHTQKRPMVDGDLTNLIQKRQSGSDFHHTTAIMSAELAAYIFAQLRMILSDAHKMDTMDANKHRDGLYALQILEEQYRPKILRKQISKEQDTLREPFVGSHKSMDAWLRDRHRAHTQLMNLNKDYKVPESMQVNDLLLFIKGIAEFETEYNTIHGEKATITLAKCESLLRAAEERGQSPRKRRYGESRRGGRGGRGVGRGGGRGGFTRTNRWEREPPGKGDSIHLTGAGDGAPGRGSTNRCFRCGQMGHRRNNCTLPIDCYCKACRLKGHVAGVCKSVPPALKQKLDDDANGRSSTSDKKSHTILTELVAKLEELTSGKKGRGTKRERSESRSPPRERGEKRSKPGKSSKSKQESSDDESDGDSHFIQAMGAILPRVLATKELGRELRRNPLYMLLDTCSDNDHVGENMHGLKLRNTKRDRFVLTANVKEPVRIIGLGSMERVFQVGGKDSETHRMKFDSVQVIKDLDTVILSTKRLEAKGYVLTEGIRALRTPTGAEIPVYRLGGFPAIKCEEMEGRKRNRGELTTDAKPYATPKTK